MAEHELTPGILPAFSRARDTENLVALSLVLIILTASAAGVTSVLLGPDWGSLWRGLLFGLLSGWVLAIFRRPAWQAAWVILVLGLIYVFFFVGGMGEKTSVVAAELFHIAGRILFAMPGVQVDWIPLAARVGELLSSIEVILGRIQVWVVALASGQPVFDPVAAALVWSTLVWNIAGWAGWVVEARKNALLAVMPAVMLSLATLSYARRTSFVLYLILGSTLLLAAIVGLERLERVWDQQKIAYPARKGRQVGIAALTVSLLLVLLAALLPSISINRIADWFSSQGKPVPGQDSGLAKSLGIIPAVTSPPDAFRTERRPGLPRELLIGSGPQLSKQIVMTVAPESLLSRTGEPLIFYWRSFTYNLYTGHGWQSSSTNESVYGPNQPLGSNRESGHELISQVVRPVGGGDGVLYAAGEPVEVNLQSEAARRPPEDLFGVRIEPGSYQVLSLIPVVDERSLRDAGQRYPEWVRQRYLDLPPDLPGRVKALAIELTASEPTPYDRARTIEEYLRKFPYTLDVPRPPSDRDLVDYFLFDLKKGYCDYYASAMVVMARAAGIPARLAIGYASGTYNINSNRFVVTQADAHSWVEVYFPGIGWVPFEPTAARPSLELSQPAVSKTPPAAASSEESSGSNQTMTLPWKKFLPIGGLSLIAVLLITWAAFEEIRLRRLSEPAAAVEVYRRLYGWLNRFALTFEPGYTPYEVATSFHKWLQESILQNSNQAFVGQTGLQVQSVIDRIVRTSYNPSWPEQSQDSAIVQQWKALRWRLGLLWALQKWISIRKSFVSSAMRIQREGD